MYAAAHLVEVFEQLDQSPVELTAIVDDSFSRELRQQDRQTLGR